MARSIKVRIRSEALEERLANLGPRSNAAMRLALQESADMVRDYAKSTTALNQEVVNLKNL